MKWWLLVLSAACGGSHPMMPPHMCQTLCTTPSLAQLDVVAGQPGAQGWVDAAGADAHFADPWSFASDGAGKLYLADGQTLRAIELASAKVTTLGGTYGKVGTTDGSGADALVNTPSGIAVYQGALWFSDTENHTIRKLALQSGTFSTVAGAAGMPGTTDDVGPNARFREPEGLAVDSAGNLYIADVDNDTIRVMSTSTLQVKTLAGVAAMGGTADGSATMARFNKPKAMVFDGSTYLYVVDSANSSVRKVAIADGTTSTVATLPVAPNGIALDGTDVLVTVDDRVVRIGAGGALSTLTGTQNMIGFVDGDAQHALLARPAGLWNDGAGTLYLADDGNFAIRKIAVASGAVTTFAGARSDGSADGTGRAARFFTPQGMTADSKGNVYVADTNNHTVRLLVLSSGVVTTIAGMAQAPGAADGSGAQAQFNQPSGLALDEAGGILWIADTGNRAIRKLTLATGAVSTVGYDVTKGDPFLGFQGPTGIALDGSKLYVSDYVLHVVVVLDLQTMKVSSVAGKPMAAGGTDATGGQARFDEPTGIATDGSGKLFVADALNHAVRVIDLASGAVTTLAGMLDVQGVDDGTGPAARFAFPTQLALDGVGDLYVADSLSDRVRHVDTATGTVTTVLGTLGRSGVETGPVPAQLGVPTALALPPTGLLVASENAILWAH